MHNLYILDSETLSGKFITSMVGWLMGTLQQTLKVQTGSSRGRHKTLSLQLAQSEIKIENYLFCAKTFFRQVSEL